MMIKCVAFFILISSALLSANESATLPGRDLFWTMISVSSGPQQADSHLIEFPDGHRVLIDAGFLNRKLLDYLDRESISSVDQVMITHPHKDHYGGLEYAIVGGLKVGEVYMNRPLRVVCDREIGWGCDYAHVERVRTFVEDHRIALRSAQAGQVVYRMGDQSLLEVLYASDGQYASGGSDVNDMSLQIRLTHLGHRVLFTGDLNRSLGNTLAESNEDLAAEAMTAPHHGTEDCAPDRFFDRVGPTFFFVSSPRRLWLSPRSGRMRRYVRSHSLKAFITGIHGVTHVRIGSDGLKVSPEKGMVPW